jgi:hypothetical protein
VDTETKGKIEARIREISRELGLLDPAELSLESPAPEYDLEEMEELYAERERLLQELEKDC